MLCETCFHRQYIENRSGKNLEVKIIIWKCLVTGKIIVKLVKVRGKTIERKVVEIDNCEHYSKVPWKLEPFKSVTE